MTDLAQKYDKILAHYPSPEEVDAWVAELWACFRETKSEVVEVECEGPSKSYGARHHSPAQYLKFSPEGRDSFYAIWQPTFRQPAPLLIHLPGYGAEMSVHPELVHEGFNVLHINPLGYCTPEGLDLRHKRGTESFQVQDDTFQSLGKKGYPVWLQDAMIASEWAIARSECLDGRYAFFGTSQGGAGTLLMSSIFKDKGVKAAAADVPYLTHLPMSTDIGGYQRITELVEPHRDDPDYWHAMGRFDTLAHAHRLDIPVLLLAGSKDTSCIPQSIEALFRQLPSTRSYTLCEGVAHGYTREFLKLASTWMKMYC